MNNKGYYISMLYNSTIYLFIINKLKKKKVKGNLFSLLHPKVNFIFGMRMQRQFKLECFISVRSRYEVLNSIFHFVDDEGVVGCPSGEVLHGVYLLSLSLYTYIIKGKKRNVNSFFKIF